MHDREHDLRDRDERSVSGPGASGEVRWGILGAAHIAEVAFLPGLREAGGGRAALVASRDLGRAGAFAASQRRGVSRRGLRRP